MENYKETLEKNINNNISYKDEVLSVLNKFINNIKDVVETSNLALGPFSFLSVKINDAFTIMIEYVIDGEVPPFWKFWEKTKYKYLFTVYEIKTDKKYEITKEQFLMLFNELSKLDTENVKCFVNKVERNKILN